MFEIGWPVPEKTGEDPVEIALKFPPLKGEPNFKLKTISYLQLFSVVRHLIENYNACRNALLSLNFELYFSELNSFSENNSGCSECNSFLFLCFSSHSFLPRKAAPFSIKFIENSARSLIWIWSGGCRETAREHLAPQQKTKKEVRSRLFSCVFFAFYLLPSTFCFHSYHFSTS